MLAVYQSFDHDVLSSGDDVDSTETLSPPPPRKKLTAPRMSPSLSAIEDITSNRAQRIALKRKQWKASTSSSKSHKRAVSGRARKKRRICGGDEQHSRAPPPASLLALGLDEGEDGADVVHSFLPYIRDLENRYDEEFRRKRPTYQDVPQIHEYYLESSSRRWVTHCSGDERLAAMRHALRRLDGLGYMRSNHQRDFHELFIGACLPQFYGDDLDRCLIRILEENGLDAIHSEVMVVTPRRWGKTMAVALFLAAYLYTQPDGDVCVYSIARRTSTMLVLKVYKMVVALAGGTHVIKRSNQEVLEVLNIHGSISKCSSYPAASKIRCDPPPLHTHSISISVCVCALAKDLGEKKGASSSAKKNLYYILGEGVFKGVSESV